MKIMLRSIIVVSLVVVSCCIGNVQAGVMDVFNIKDYGAVANDSIDDSAAIQNAINAAAVNGGIVFVPEGTFLAFPSPGLSVASNVHLKGTGKSSIIKIPNNVNVTGNLLKVESKTNVMISDLSLDGNRAAQSVSDTHYGVYVAASENIKVNSVWTINFRGVGNHIYRSSGVVVSDCISTNNLYHGFEAEQTLGSVWIGNRGYKNDRHGIFISPGEVGGSGAKGNMISNNSFESNLQYGIAVGVAAAPGSEQLTYGNVISNNSVRYNVEYGVSLYNQDGTILMNNLIEYNGFFGIYGYKTWNNQVTGNHLHNNSQAGNGSYDEILFEGNEGQPGGRASKNNIISNNIINIDGTIKARWAIREANATDGPNTVVDNIIPNPGTSGKIEIKHLGTKTSSPAGVALVGGGQFIQGQNAGIDNGFGILRLFSDLSNSEVQVVSPRDDIKFWSNGQERLVINRFGEIIANTDKFRLSIPRTIASSTDYGPPGEITWDQNYIYICVAWNTWKRIPLATW